MSTITKLILGSSLIIASTLSFAGDNYNYGSVPYNNDWRAAPQGRNNSPMNWDSNNTPWSGGNMPWSGDNPMWDRGSDIWRDWDTNKWGYNGMPWGGDGFMNDNKMPWSKNKKANRYYNNPQYGRPYGGAYGYPYPYPYQGGVYGDYPYNPAPVPPPAR